MSRDIKITLHIIVPVLVWLVLSGMYFSGHIVLQRLVSPKLPPLAVNTWREYGLLENLQNLLLLSMVGVAAHGALVARERGRRLGLVLLAMVALVVLLEEMDYGTLWASYARAAPLEWFVPETLWSPALAEAGQRVDAFNLHTAHGRFTWMKKIADVCTFAFFVVLPLVVKRGNGTGLLARWSPDRWMVVTTGIMAFLRLMTHNIARWDATALARVAAAGGRVWETGSMGSNLSEFGELLLYYCCALYLFQQAYTQLSAAAVSVPRRPPS